MLNENNLHNYQKTAIEFIKTNKKCGLFLDMGLGKTASTLTAINSLLDDFMIDKVLVIAPLRVANTVWHNEAKKWEHLQHLTFSIITGTLTKRVTALNKKADIYIINMENIAWLQESHLDTFKFDMLVVDESSTFKNPTSKRFKSLKKFLPNLNYSVILTGTPSPKGYMDLWSQVYLLDGGKRLGRNITTYRNNYFTQDYMRFNYTLKDDSAKKIQGNIQDIVISMKAKDYLELPDYLHIVENGVLPVKLDKQYSKFRNDMYMDMGEGEIIASSMGVLTNKLLQFCSGAMYDEQGNTIQLHNIKIDMLKEVIEYNEGEPLLVAYNYKHELERLLKTFPQGVRLDGKNDNKIIEKWNKREIPLLFMHPASGGHGLNLQQGSNIVVWFGFNWSLELYQQLNARLYRQGQTKPVKIIHLAVGDIEHKLMRSLKDKNITQEGLFTALKNKGVL